MTMHNMTIRIDEDLKNGASRVAEYYGFDLSSVTRAFYKQMVDTRSIPLTLNPSGRATPFSGEDETIDEIDALSMEVVEHAR